MGEKKLATLTKSAQQQPRFQLSLKKGRVFYTCRGCKNRYHRLEFLLQHLKVCDLF
jgi:hypothetical protein